MKSIFTLLIFVSLSVTSFSQAPYEMYNKGKVTNQELIYEKGDVMTVLVDNSTNPPSVYVLENMVDSVYTIPVTPPNWTITRLYKDHKTIYHFNIGDNYRVVNDIDGNSYLELH